MTLTKTLYMGWVSIAISLSTPINAYAEEYSDTLNQQLEFLQQQWLFLDQDSQATRSQLQEFQRASVQQQQELRELRNEMQESREQISQLENKRDTARDNLNRLQTLLNQTLNLSRLHQNSQWTLAWLSDNPPHQSSRQMGLLRHSNRRIQTIRQRQKEFLQQYQTFAQDMHDHLSILENTEQALLQKSTDIEELLESRTALLQDIHRQKTLVLKAQLERKKLLQQQEITQRNATKLALQTQQKQPTKHNNTHNITPKVQKNENQKNETLKIALLSVPQHLPPPKRGELISPLSGNVLEAPQGLSIADPIYGLLIDGSLQEYVLAPYGGQVVFSDKYGDLGQTLIIQHAENHYSLLWNLATLEVLDGQWLLPGEPIGKPLPNPTNTKRGLVYLEFRHNNKLQVAEQWLHSRSNFSQK